MQSEGRNGIAGATHRLPALNELKSFLQSNLIASVRGASRPAPGETVMRNEDWKAAWRTAPLVARHVLILG